MKNVSYFLLFYLCGLIPSMLFGQLSVSKMDASGCGKQDGSISASIPVADVEYALNGAGYQSSGQFNNLGAGTYTVTARKKGSNNSCMARESVEIEDGSDIMASVSGGGSFQFCIQDGPPDVSLFCSASGGTPPLTFSWPNGRLDNAGPGTHTCTVTDKDGCRDDASATVVHVPIRCSRDPNDIAGPVGYGESKWVSVKDVMPYLIRFENDPDFATAPAVRVAVEYVLDDDLNLFSVRLGDFGFANIQFSVPANSTFYSARLDVRDSLNVFVDVNAGIDVTEKKVFWIFEAIDPATGLAVTDPDLGMLPVNDTITKRGEGFVNFTVKPKSTTLTGDTILAKADILFDANEVISTNEYINLVDAFPPVSQLTGDLPDIADSTEFTVKWTGQDDAGGCGIRDYTLFVSINDGPFQVYQSNITDTFLVFQGVEGATYSFFTVAKDNVGNAELPKSEGDDEITISGDSQVEIIGFNAEAVCAGDSLQINWTFKQVEALDVLFSTSGPGGPFEVLGNDLDPDTGYFQWETTKDKTCMPCYVIVRDTAAGSLASDTAVTTIFDLPAVEAGSNVSICAGTSAQLQAEGALNYLWTPGANLSSATVFNPYFFSNEVGVATLYVQGTDANGCKNTDSVAIDVNTQPEVLISGNPNICPGDSTTLTASGGNSYAWSTGENDPTIVVDQAGVYLVTVTSSNNCSATGSITVGIGITEEPLAEAAVRVFLQGPYVSNVQLMHDSLRVQGLIPLEEPYTGMTNFTHVGGGGETTTQFVLDQSGTNAVVDWVFLELRNAANDTQVVSTRAALLQRDGDIVDVDGMSSVIFHVDAGKSYYITVRHRNHLGVQLGEPVFFQYCEAVPVDFTTLPPEGFYSYNGLNTAQRSVSGRYALWSGNGRIDYQIKYNGSANDRSALLSTVGISNPNNIVSGYLTTDYNMDGKAKYNGSSNDRNVLLGSVGIATPSNVIHDQIAR